MIVGSLSQVAQQAATPPGIQKALDFLQRAVNEDLPDGRVTIDGSAVYALVQSYESRAENDNPTFEAHRRYVDIQYIVSGSEVLGWAPLDELSVTVPYDGEKDALLGTVPPEAATLIRFAAGQAIVLYPTDAHAPGLAAGEPGPVKKTVVKIALDR